MSRVYADYNAGAPLRPAARERMLAALDAGGNASSVHGDGRRAKAFIEQAREDLGQALCARAQDIVFTSGATEALHLALAGAKAAGAGPALILSALEHDALAEGADALWPGAQTAPALAGGVIDFGALRALVRAAGASPLVALQLANNETGALQPVKAAAALVHEAGGYLLVDAAQAFGKIAVDGADLGADYLVVSSHKIGGPPGAGALVLGCNAPFTPPHRGGGQEQGRRPGTENAPAIAGFGAAAIAAISDLEAADARVRQQRDHFEAGLRARFADVTIFAEDSERLGNTSLFAVPGLRAEAALIALDLEGVSLSSGAACSSGKVRASRVLKAMGVAPDLAACALRASFGWATSFADVERALAALSHVSTRARHREYAA
jgi:cysteine desulfurase